MSKLSWKQWTAIGILLAALITGVVLHLKQPEVSYAFTEIVAVVSFVLGGGVMWLFKSKKIINN